MELLDISIKIPAILLTTTVMTMVFLMIKVLECLWVIGDVDMGLLGLANITIAIVEFIIVVIKVVTMVEVGIGLKIPATLPNEILEQ